MHDTNSVAQHTETTAAPACPRCGECQQRDEARPSRPRVTRNHRTGRRMTVYDSECRRCGAPIRWGFRYGSGTFGEMFKAPIIYSWTLREPTR
jgi:hypothetical protein